jgi:hypothetical protein
MLLGVAWTRTDQVKRSGVDRAFQGSTALAKRTMFIGHALPVFIIRPRQRRHVELPSAPFGFGALLSNQLHTSSNQTILRYSQNLRRFARSKSRPGFARSGEQEKGEQVRGRALGREEGRIDYAAEEQMAGHGQGD